MRYNLDPQLPNTSKAIGIAFPARNILIRPHSPSGFRAGGAIYVEKNEKWAKIWGWILAVREDDFVIDPDLVPGSMVIFKRHADSEPLAYDTPQQSLYYGHKLAISMVHIDSLECVFDESPTPAEY